MTYSGSRTQHLQSGEDTLPPFCALTSGLLQAYPFALLVDDEGRIRALGRFFESRFPALLNRPIFESFTLTDPVIEAGEWKDIKPSIGLPDEQQRIELLFEPQFARGGGDAGARCAPTSALRLAGAFLSYGIARGSLFLGTIAPGDIRNMAALGLSIGDFGSIDPSPEFAMMAEVNASMLADSQMMNKQLRASRDDALAAQKELERHRAHLEDVVEERTEVIQRQATDLEQALQHEKQLSALQRSFVSMASHEFRTPLAIIDGNAQRLERRFKRLSADDVAAGLKKIRSAVTRMTSLMESTLAAAKAQDGKIEIDPKPVDIRELLSDCCKVQQELVASHDIVVDHQGLPGNIVADNQALVQIISNLLSNAVKYSPEADRVIVRGLREGDGISISVQDFGLGVEVDEQAQMFQRFFRARTSVGIPGTGIGLNLAQLLAKEHGGSIEFRSEKGKGSVFTLKLPIDCRPE